MRPMILRGDCFKVMQAIADNSISAIVTDPPYGLKFMGKKWDHEVPKVEVFAEMLRICKPGAMLLCFGGTRTYHRMVCNIEDAGFEIRDMIEWIYGSGFPKSLNVSAAIDKAAGAEREVVGKYAVGGTAAKDGRQGRASVSAEGESGVGLTRNLNITSPATPEAKQWDGWGTALKPAHEPICLARKPFPGTVAENVLMYGTGAMNIDGCRVAVTEADASQLRTMNRNQKQEHDGWGMNQNGDDTPQVVSPLGRFPANLIHDGSPEVVKLFPETISGKPCGIKSVGKGNAFGEYGVGIPVTGFGDAGSAARFFYAAKPSRAERNGGLDGMSKKMLRWSSGDQNPGAFQSANTDRMVKNFHPTVKPLSLMQYLVRLVTPPQNGIILDPYAGSGTTMCACILENVQGITIERDAEYLPIIKGRISFFMNGGRPVYDEEARDQPEQESRQIKLF